MSTEIALQCPLLFTTEVAMQCSYYLQQKQQCSVLIICNRSSNVVSVTITLLFTKIATMSTEIALQCPLLFTTEIVMQCPLLLTKEVAMQCPYYLQQKQQCSVLIIYNRSSNVVSVIIYNLRFTASDYHFDIID